jgi:hypothetical protein
VDEPSTRSWLSLEDDRVRVVGLTTPVPGQVLVRLQSVAEAPVDVRVRAAWSIERAQRASFLGAPQDEISVDNGGVTIRVEKFGVAAILFTLR